MAVNNLSIMIWRGGLLPVNRDAGEWMGSQIRTLVAAVTGGTEVTLVIWSTNTVVCLRLGTFKFDFGQILKP